METSQSKIKNIASACKITAQWKQEQRRIVFTNGCFDILHAGHICYLEEARSLGDRLIVGINTDYSVRNLKGIERPIQTEKSRVCVIAALQCVDMVILFNEDTPLSLIEEVAPNILVKGGDYLAENVIGATFVRQNGGEVVIIDFLPDYSTSLIINKIKKQ